MSATPAPAPAPAPSSPPTPQGGAGGDAEFLKTWEEWTRYLEEEGKPLSPTREARHRKLLANDPPALAVARLRMAMERGWRAPADPGKLAAAASPPPETDEQRRDRVRAERARREEMYGPASPPARSNGTAGRTA